MVDDLGYNVKAVIQEYSGFRNGPVGDVDFLPLADRLYRAGYVKSEQDAIAVAEVAITSLYVDITQLVKGLGYIAAGIVSTRFRVTKRNRAIFCDVIMVVM